MSEVLRFQVAAESLRARTDNLSGVVRVAIEGLLSDIHCVIEQNPERASSVAEFIEIVNNSSSEFVEHFFGFYANSSDIEKQEIKDYLLSGNQDDDGYVPKSLISFFCGAINDLMKRTEYNISSTEKTTHQIIGRIGSADFAAERLLLSMMDPPTKTIH